MGKIRKHKTKKKPGTATKSLETIALNKKKQNQFSKKTKLAKKIRKNNPTSKSLSHGVIRLTNIPHGFYEEAMQRYFGQFGKVMDIKVVRSRKSAKPLGLAYVKFQYRGVARLVAQSMNGYLMFNKIMRCKYIKSAKVSEIMMFGNKFTKAESCPAVLKHRFTVDEYNRNRTADEDLKRQSRLAEKMQKKERMLKNMGLNINLNVPEDKIHKKEKPSNPSTIKEEHLTLEESKKFDEAKEELANTIKAKLEEQKENSPEDDSDSDTENEEDLEAQTIIEVDESEDEIVLKTPPNAVKKAKRKSAVEEPKSLKKKKLELDNSAPTPKMKTPKMKTPKIKTPKPKNNNTETPKFSKQKKKLNLEKDNEKTPLSNKMKISKTKAATPGLKTPKMKKKLKVPQSA